MISLHDETICSRKRDQMKVFGESFHGSFKRSKQGHSESGKLTKPDVQLQLDVKTESESFEDHETFRYLKEPVSLDLELNLFSPSVKTIMKKNESSRGGNLIMTPSKKGISGDIRLSRSPSWLAFEGDDDDNQKTQEMVTTVCIKCHMLVMLCKSTLVCPNCKFMHPRDHSSTIYTV